MIRTLQLLFLVLPLLASAKVYRTIDENGNVVFSDEAPADAEEVKLRAPSTFSNEDYVGPMQQRQSSATEAPETVRYDNLEITYPEDEATIRNKSEIDVGINISPAVQPGHLGYFEVDGRVHSEVSGPTVITLTNVYRGAHTLRVRIVDRETRKPVQGGAAVTIYVHRAAAN